MNKKVSYQQAKLLKEKGFDENCESWAYLDDNCMSMTYDSKTCVKVPTIADVIMWLYEKHGIWIEVKRVVLGSDEWGFSYVISYLPKEYSFVKRRSPYLVNIESFKEGIGSYIGAWDEPQEAYQAAIDYCLNNIV